MKLVKQLSLAAALASILFSPAAFAKDAKIGDLLITQPWIRATMVKSDVASAYAGIENTGKEDDTLLSITVDGAPEVQIHQMQMEGDVMKMSEMPDGLVIKAGSKADLLPKQAHHIMLMGLKKPFRAGDVVKGSMTFKKAGKVDIEFEVMDGAMSGMKMK